MAHWFDGLSKSIGRLEYFRGTPSVAKVVRARPARLSRQKARVAQRGQCTMWREKDLLSQTFSAQAATSSGHYLTYDVLSSRDLKTGATSASTTILRDGERLLHVKTESMPGEASKLWVEFGHEVQADPHMQVTVCGEKADATLEDGHSFALDPRANRPLHGKRLENSTAVLEALGLAAEVRLPKISLDELTREEIREISQRASREMLDCFLFPEQQVLNQVLDYVPASFPGCSDCEDECGKKQTTCIAKAAGEAGTCGPFYGVCFGVLGAMCLSDDADCLAVCDNPPGKCCPVRCQRGGTAECCDGGRLCCGGRCCPEGQICADPGSDLCCAVGSGPACGDFCCPSGTKCASHSQGVCCPAGAGDYCPDEWGTPQCCPPGEVCVDPSSGLCCPRDHGPACGEFCCGPNEVCMHGQCCSPNQLCGEGDNAVCCTGVCRHGQCCEWPAHICGHVCCPPFNLCCQTWETVATGFGSGIRTQCCGAGDLCTGAGCCPQDRICGQQCCPEGHQCTDPAKGVCVPCSGELAPCRTYVRGAFETICCPATQTCCLGKCCPPGTTCCTIGEQTGCFAPYQCVH